MGEMELKVVEDEGGERGMGKGEEVVMVTQDIS
jgi:hypothetical protein